MPSIVGDEYIKAHCKGMVNCRLCKNTSVDLSLIVMKDNFSIYVNNKLMITKQKKRNY